MIILINKRLALICCVLFIINFSITYPGSLAEDSFEQYRQAYSKNFSPHHPPIMAGLWSIFISIYMHPATMLFFHLIMLWGAIYNFCIALSGINFNLSLIYLIIGFSPLVLNYSMFILKDVSFAFSYLYAASILTKLTISGSKFTIDQIIIFTLILFYGTGVKYQAISAAPSLILWFIFLMKRSYYNQKGNSLSQFNNIYKNFQLSKQKLVVTLVLSLMLFYSIKAVNLALVNKNQNISVPRNSWQLVKLYDLAGISILSNRLYFPQYIIDSTIFNVEKFKQKFSHHLVDPLVFGRNSVLIGVEDKERLDKLKACWQKTVLDHPYLYLKHRFLMFYNMLNAKYHVVVMPEFTSNPPEYKIKINIFKIIIEKYLHFFQRFSSLMFIVCLIPIYCILGIFHHFKYKQSIALPLIFYNLGSISLLGTLFFFSMADEHRYLLFCHLSILFTSPIAYKCIRDLIEAR